MRWMLFFCSGISIEILNHMFQRSNINRSVNISGVLGLGHLSVHSHLLNTFIQRLNFQLISVV